MKQGKFVYEKLDLQISVHIFCVGQLNVPQCSGLHAVSIGRVLEGEGPANDLQGGRLRNPSLNLLDLQSETPIITMYPVPEKFGLQ